MTDSTLTTTPRAAAAPPIPHRRDKGANPAKSVLKHIALVIASVGMIYPLLWMLASSFRPNDVIFRESGLLVTDLHLENYTTGWNALNDPFGHYMLNTAIIVLGSIFGNVVSCSLAAYAFARLRFTFKNIFFAIMLLTIMLPHHVVIVPQYIMFSKLPVIRDGEFLADGGWINTFLPLIVPKLLATDAFFVFLMVQFIRGLPRELDEAARIDGCGHFRIFSSIIMPLMTPAIATTTIFTFIWTWNDFFSPLIYLTTPKNHTVSLALRQFLDASGQSNWGAMFAMSVISLLPVFLAFLIGQRWLVKGIATTGIK
jgi:multiple sugar transport system permease protein